jgi:hypothetical protein
VRLPNARRGRLARVRAGFGVSLVCLVGRECSLWC